MDFITQLPESRHGNTQIIVFTDHLTKMCHFVPAPTPLEAEQVAGMYLRMCSGCTVTLPALF